MMMDGGTVVDPSITGEGLKDDIVKELRQLGTCDLCCLRYLLVKDAWVYRAESKLIQNILMSKEEKSGLKLEDDGPPTAKLSKRVPCTVCLGLLENGVQEDFLQKIVEEVKKADVESISYSPNLTLPVSIQIRAQSMWTHLCDKFPSVYQSAVSMWKPEGISLKSAWKYICTDSLKKNINPSSEWLTEGSLVINIFLNYCDDTKECEPLLKIIPTSKRNRNISEVSRISADSLFSSMKGETFRKHFIVPPAPPEASLSITKIVCSHNSLFVAGRYCKYSRDVSQSPWLNPDGSRVRGQGSVQEFIADHIYPMFNCENVRFSASGREDTDVRMLGLGRPFSIEIVNPKRSLFTPDKIKELKEKINASTKLISVRDLQIVEKDDLVHLKEGEETKSKLYCALCRTPGKEVTPEMLHILNTTPMPIELHQKTPIRVLHRRNLDVRTRNVLSMTASLANKSKEMFILKVQTDAGTYVKEFVHGDLGRTKPSVGDLIGSPTEILSLDVDAVLLNWPPVIDD